MDDLARQVPAIETLAPVIEPAPDDHEIVRGDDDHELTAVAGGEKAMVKASADPNQRARENLTLVLYNHNDFVTIH